MSQDKTHVYFVPGLAAGREIFKNIALPEDKYEIHVLEWLIPEKNESMESYAGRMAARIDKPKSVLVGVSFGGVVAQEMSKQLELKKLVIISSVKCRKEIPSRLRIASNTRAYKLVPTKMMLSADDLTKFAIGPRSKKRLQLYQTFLHVREKVYLDWAIKNMVCWNQKDPLPDVIHLHGDKDIIFPIKNITGCRVVENGTHIMLLDKGKAVSKMLEEVLEE